MCTFYIVDFYANVEHNNIMLVIEINNYCLVRFHNKALYLQLSQCSPANSEGNYFDQNMRVRNILATSVLFNYPKVCPLTKIFF